MKERQEHFVFQEQVRLNLSVIFFIIIISTSSYSFFLRHRLMPPY